ncbi:MAG: mechanosensitive ion channel family protein [Balneolaceae bacterium]
MLFRLSTYFVSIVSLVLLLSAHPIQAQSTNKLPNPRKAVHTFSYWQQKGHQDFEKAALPMKLANKTLAGRIELSKNLMRILDAHGLIIDYSIIPDAPDYVDSLSEMSHYVLFNKLPDVFLVRKDNEWVFSETTIEQIPILYNATFSSFIESIIDRLPQWAKQKWLGIALWQHIAVFSWILIGLLLRKVFEFILNNFIRRFTKRTKFKWDEDLLDGVEKPIGFIFLIGFYFSSYTNLQFSVTTNHILSTVLEVTVSIGFVWLFYNLSEVFTKYLSKVTSKTDPSLDDQLIPLIRKTLRFFVIFMGVVVIMQNNGYNVASLIAGLGIGGLAVALAARETLANFFGSVTIFLDKPFKVGDWIKVGDVEGTVVEVGFRSTRIRTFYTSLITVPNSKLADTEIDNLGLREYRRFITHFELKLNTPPEKLVAFVEGVKGIIKSNKHFRQDYYEIHLNEIGQHSLRILVYAFFKVPDYTAELTQRHNFLIEVLRLAKAVGVEFTYPTQTLHLVSSNKDETETEVKELTEEELVARIFDFGPGGKEGKPDGFKIYKDGKEVNFGSDS